MIAASIIFLILTANDSAAAWRLEAKQSPGLVASPVSNVTSETDFLNSLTTGATIPGIYELSFIASQGGVLVPVVSLPVLSQELILMAHVEDTNGNPAQAGTVTFEYCSYKGGPPNDINRADEAPKEACDAGIATWDRLARRNIAGSCPSSLGPGNACLNFGIVRIPRDVGFRFKFAGPRRGGVDSGMSDELNFTWTAAL